MDEEPQRKRWAQRWATQDGERSHGDGERRTESEAQWRGAQWRRFECTMAESGEHQEMESTKRWRAPRMESTKKWRSKDLIRLSLPSFAIEPPRSLLYSKWPREEAKGERAKRVKVGMKRVGGRRNLPPSPSIALAIFGRERKRKKRSWLERTHHRGGREGGEKGRWKGVKRKRQKHGKVFLKGKTLSICFGWDLNPKPIGHYCITLTKYPFLVPFCFILFLLYI